MYHYQIKKKIICFVFLFLHCMSYILSISLSDFVGIVSLNLNVLRSPIIKTNLTET